jgi:hypothetical protein
MNTTQMKSFREQLLRMSSRLRGDVLDLSEEACHPGDGNLSNLPLHPADLGTDAFTDSCAARLSFFMAPTMGHGQYRVGLP